MLSDDPSAAVSPADPTHAVAKWMVATPSERAEALIDLLLLADALPYEKRKDEPLLFPQMESQPR
jgi:hypothetical protein